MKKWKIPWPGQWTKKKKIFHSSLLYSGKDFIVSAALFFVTVVLCLLLRSVDTHRDTSYVAVIFFLDVFLDVYKRQLQRRAAPLQIVDVLQIAVEVAHLRE